MIGSISQLGAQPCTKNNTYPPVNKHSYWKWPIYGGFTHWTWWFSIVMLVYQRVTHQAATSLCILAILAGAPPTRPEFPGGGRSYRLSHPKKSLFKRQFFTSLEKLHNCFVKEKHPQEGVLVRNAVCLVVECRRCHVALLRKSLETPYRTKMAVFAACVKTAY